MIHLQQKTNRDNIEALYQQEEESRWYRCKTNHGVYHLIPSCLCWEASILASAFIADATESCDKGFAAVVDEFKMLDYYQTYLSSIGVYKLHVTIDCRLCTHIAPFNKSSTQTVHMHRHARTQKDTHDKP